MIIPLIERINIEMKDKAGDVDEISIKILKTIRNCILKILRAYIFNLCIARGV